MDKLAAICLGLEPPFLLWVPSKQMTLLAHGRLYDVLQAVKLLYMRDGNVQHLSELQLHPDTRLDRGP